MDNMFLDKNQALGDTDTKSGENVLDYLKRVQAGKNGKANNYFSDEEYRILLSALAREREVCKKWTGTVVENQGCYVSWKVLSARLQKCSTLRSPD